jgi:hypothetical protein
MKKPTEIELELYFAILDIADIIHTKDRAGMFVNSIFNRSEKLATWFKESESFIMEEIVNKDKAVTDNKVLEFKKGV